MPQRPVDSQVDSIALIPRPTRLPGDIHGWMETFFECFTAALAPSQRPALADEVREALRPKLCDADGRWTADYVLLRFAATKPRPRDDDDAARRPRGRIRSETRVP